MCISKTHDVKAGRPVSAQEAEQVARVMAALATPSRVRILARLRAEDCTVGELTSEIGMEQPAVSHQLRLLRDLDLVRSTRRGRHVVYGLHDPHVAALLDEALRHVDHLRTDGGEVQVAHRTVPDQE